MSRPIRTNEPGTGVFIGSGLLGQIRINRESNAREKLTETVTFFDFRYTPATHWVFGVRLPFILERTLEMDPARSTSTQGVGDTVLTAKHRFFRSVGRWSDRHAAVEVEWKLPTGSAEQNLTGSLPLHRRRQLQPGTGSHDFLVDLVYQEGRGRMVYGGDISYRFTTEDDGRYEFGNEAMLNLDFEYILLPRVYRRPGNELFILLETTLRHKEADQFRGSSIPSTRRTELLLAPGAQYIATERLLFSVSVQFPLYSRVEAGGLERDFNILGEFRFAF